MFDDIGFIELTKHEEEHAYWLNQRLTFLYYLGCNYGIADHDMERLCKYMQVPFPALLKHDGEMK